MDISSGDGLEYPPQGMDRSCSTFSAIAVLYGTTRGISPCDIAINVRRVVPPELYSKEITRGRVIFIPGGGQFSSPGAGSFHPRGSGSFHPLGRAVFILECRAFFIPGGRVVYLGSAISSTLSFPIIPLFFANHVALYRIDLNYPGGGIGTAPIAFLLPRFIFSFFVGVRLEGLLLLSLICISCLSPFFFFPDFGAILRSRDLTVLTYYTLYLAYEIFCTADGI